MNIYFPLDNLDLKPLTNFAPTEYTYEAKVVITGSVVELDETRAAEVAISNVIKQLHEANSNGFCAEIAGIKVKKVKK